MIWEETVYRNDAGKEIRKLAAVGTEEVKFVGHAVRLRPEPGRTIRCPFQFVIPAENIEEAYRNWDAAIAPAEEAADAQIAKQTPPKIQRVPAGALSAQGRLATKPRRG